MGSKPLKLDTNKNSKFAEYQFVFYNYSRLKQIQKQSKFDGNRNEVDFEEKNIKPEEWSLIIEVLWFSCDLENPEKMVAFLRESSHKIARFYSRHRVIDTKYENTRIKLVELLVNLHDMIFAKLGIIPINRM